MTWSSVPSWLSDHQYRYHSCVDEHPPFNLEALCGRHTPMASWDVEKSEFESIHGRGSLWMMPWEARALYAIFNYSPNVDLLPEELGDSVRQEIGTEFSVLPPSKEIARGVTYDQFYRGKKEA